MNFLAMAFAPLTLDGQQNRIYYSRFV